MNIDVSPEKTRALELRHDGPIPAHLTDTPARQRRGDRGTIGVLERQAMEFLTAAIFTDTLIEEFEDGLPEHPTAEQENWVAAHRKILAAHVACAAEAITNASKLRAKITDRPSPFVAVLQAVAKEVA